MGGGWTEDDLIITPLLYSPHIISLSGSIDLYNYFPTHYISSLWTEWTKQHPSLQLFFAVTTAWLVVPCLCVGVGRHRSGSHLLSSSPLRPRAHQAQNNDWAQLTNTRLATANYAFYSRDLTALSWIAITVIYQIHHTVCTSNIPPLTIIVRQQNTNIYKCCVVFL